MVVEKLWPTVPDCSFVLVSFENELLPTAKSVALPEILRYAPDKKIRPLPRHMKNPSQHRRRRGLSMRSADYDRMLSGQKHFLEHLRHRAIGNLPVQHFLQFRISARDDIPDHH